MMRYLRSASKACGVSRIGPNADGRLPRMQTDKRPVRAVTAGGSATLPGRMIQYAAPAATLTNTSGCLSQEAIKVFRKTREGAGTVALEGRAMHQG